MKTTASARIGPAQSQTHESLHPYLALTLHQKIAAETAAENTVKTAAVITLADRS